uniref:FtsJ-like methyltransferase n=1 Tax=Pithovirus LCDPAC01 TaxID=2506600 RepID=A0A481YPN0_9VIRU|nr:MAG: FtsJ-like methyltransferase [Pithovirus LCDPAC01]
MISIEKQLDEIDITAHEKRDYSTLKKRYTWYIDDIKRKLMRTHSKIPVTRGTIKGFELLSFKEVKDSYGINNTMFFNSELPGGFIFAAKEFFELKNDNWVFCSLYPRKVIGQTTAAERFFGPEGKKRFLIDTYNLIGSNSSNWLGGSRVDGPCSYYLDCDMTKSSSIISVARLVRKKFPNGVGVYTADGGIGYDEKDRKRSKEQINSILLAGEVICGIMSVGYRGTMIVKIFSGLHEWTHQLIAFISLFFTKVTVRKIFTSNPLNRELYVIASDRNKTIPKFTTKIIDHILDESGVGTFGFSGEQILKISENMDKFALRQISHYGKINTPPKFNTERYFEHIGE